MSSKLAGKSLTRAILLRAQRTDITRTSFWELSRQRMSEFAHPTSSTRTLESPTAAVCCLPSTQPTLPARDRQKGSWDARPPCMRWIMTAATLSATTMNVTATVSKITPTTPRTSSSDTNGSKAIDSSSSSIRGDIVVNTGGDIAANTGCASRSPTAVGVHFTS